VNNIAGAGRPHEANAPGKRLHDIVEPYAVFKKNAVYLTRTYHVERTGPIDLMTRVSSVGEYFKMVSSRNSCEILEGFQSCYNETRIYDEDNDCGYTVHQIDALRYSQVFDEDGSPRKMTLVDPHDAQDLKQVFWLRNDPSYDSGADNFVPIDYLGDIDPVFMPPDAVANLARTAIGSAFASPAERERIVAVLEAGRNVINNLAGATLTAAGATADLAGVDDATFAARAAGRVTFEGLEQIAAVPVAGLNAANAAIVDAVSAYMRVLRLVATRIGSFFGGANNLFLNPVNALPGAVATSSRTLYENLVNPRIVRVFRTAGGATASAPSRADLVRLHALAADGVLQPNANGTGPQKVDAKTAEQRKLTAAQVAAIQGFAASMAAGGALSAATTDNIEAILQFYAANPSFSRATTVPALNEWIGKMRALVAQAEAAGDIAQSIGSRAASATTPTVLAVHEDNASVSNLHGYVTASRLNPMKAGSTSSYGAEEEQRRHGFRLADTPIMKGLIASEVAEGGRSGYDQSSSSQQRGHQGRDLDEMFEDEPVGSMFGSGVRRDAALGEIDARRSYVPQILGSSLSSVSTRFGTLAYNVDRLNALAQDELVSLVSLMYLGAPWRYETLAGFDTHNIMLPCGFLGFRIGTFFCFASLF
jgi:hypothetical protein